MERCKGYVGVACVDGNCPIANRDKYQEYGIPVVWNCDECHYYNGCKDCAMFGTECCEVPQADVVEDKVEG